MSTANILGLLITALQAAQRRSEDDAMLRDIVRDQRVSPHQFASSAQQKMSIVGATPVITGNDGPKHSFGWAQSPQIENWRPPHSRYVDALLDADDARWRAERARELAKRGGGS